MNDLYQIPIFEGLTDGELQWLLGLPIHNDFLGVSV
jgi:hypothetical protein